MKEIEYFANKLNTSLDVGDKGFVLAVIDGIRVRINIKVTAIGDADFSGSVCDVLDQVTLCTIQYGAGHSGVSILENVPATSFNPVH